MYFTRKILLVFLCTIILSLHCCVVSSTLPINTLPLWNLCVNGGDLYSCSGHGMCNSTQDCACTDGYTGRDCSIPPGGWAYERPATATWFCTLSGGGCAPGMCVGGGSFDDTNLPDGVDGICALNPTLYGSRYAYANGQVGIPRTVNGEYSTIGQACGTCWKLIRGDVTLTVTVVDRCAGYCRATTDGVCDPSTTDGEQECGNCINQGHASVPQCSCLSPDSLDNPGYWCYGKTGVNCDWCANNDHPHFDLDQVSFNTICAEDKGVGHCTLDSFQMVDCGDFKGPWPNGYFNGSSVPTTAGGSTAVATNSGSGSTACGSVANGGYVCDNCTLMECVSGNLAALGCPAGTVCQDSACVFGDHCDPPLNSGTTSSSGTTSVSTTGAASVTASSVTTSSSSQTTTPSNLVTNSAMGGVVVPSSCVVVVVVGYILSLWY